MAIKPKVVDAHLEFDHFNLTRVGKVRGLLVHELRRGLRRIIEEELRRPKLIAKLNRAIGKNKSPEIQPSCGVSWKTSGRG